MSELPKHVAIIMDGNGRWATRRGEQRTVGHAEGARAAIRAYQAARDVGIEQLTLYTFSNANFRRPPLEVQTIMRVIGELAAFQRDDFLQRGIRLEVIGELSRIPADTRRRVQATMDATRDQDGMVLSLALAYGCQEDLLRAVRALAAEVRSGALGVEDICEAHLRQQMWTNRLADVDLMIRTGGEQRLSDFLLVESAYGELYFDEVMWPEFEPRHLQRALEWFMGRQRRYGAVESAA